MIFRMLWEIELSISLKCLPNIIRGKYMADVIRINLPTIIGATLGVVLGLGVSATALYSIGKGIQYLWGMELWELISRGNLICKVISTRCGCSCVFNKRREIPARWWFLAPKNCLAKCLWNIGTAPVDWTFDRQVRQGKSVSLKKYSSLSTSSCLLSRLMLGMSAGVAGAWLKLNTSPMQHHRKNWQNIF